MSINFFKKLGEKLRKISQDQSAVFQLSGGKKEEKRSKNRDLHGIKLFWTGGDWKFLFLMTDGTVLKSFIRYQKNKIKTPVPLAPKKTT